MGPGAMGLLFSHYLCRVFPDLVLIDIFPGRARRISKQGVTLVFKGRAITRKLRATARPEQEGAMDLVMLCVKAYDTESAIRHARPLIGKNTLVLSLQNGANNLETISGQVSRKNILAGSTAMAANIIGPATARFAGSGETVIGELVSGSGRARAVAKKFRQAGLAARVTKDPVGAIWSKLIVNAGINALSALLQVRNGILLDSDAARELMALAVREAAQVARTKGVRLLYKDPVRKVEEVARATSQNLSSMLQDALAGQRTEIDAINGAIAAEAARLGIDAPVNRLLWLLVKALEKSYDKRVEYRG